MFWRNLPPPSSWCKAEFCPKKIESNSFDGRILLAAAKTSNLALETEVIAVIKVHVAKADMKHDCTVK
jgi:hypothetical protein